ncbi:MAG: AAA family ATPase [Christensenellaceae bacterium]
MEELVAYPKGPDYTIDWAQIEQGCFSSFFRGMRATMQSPVWHAEGDVWTHTKMVCECLVALPAFRAAEERKQQEVFLAALLHDVGKIPCTRIEGGEYHSPHHALVGANIARAFLWKECGLCGDKETQNFRETVCFLIRYHSMPMHFFDERDSERSLYKIAANGALLPDFSLSLLFLLMEADMDGRRSADKQLSLDTVGLLQELALSLGCLDAPYSFPDPFSARAYLSGRNIAVGQKMYDDTFGTVILTCGLPASGKDTFLAEVYPDLPVISLDDIRQELGISPTDEQGFVVQTARERARDYLRKKQSFVWNTTALTPLIRRKNISLFEDYHAGVRIEFLETAWTEELARNRKRNRQVPQAVIEQMLDGLVPPEAFEAQEVVWRIR